MSYENLPFNKKQITKLTPTELELLKALKWIIEDFDDGSNNIESLDNAKMLISKLNI